MSSPFDEAVVLLVGASGGIGRSLVRALQDAGAARIFAASREPMDAAPGIEPLSLDVVDAEAVRKAAQAVGEKVDILIYCAGFNANLRLFAEEGDTAARQEMEVNYFGLLNVARAFGPAMRRQGRGTIVNVLTVLSHVNHPLMATYCASKAAAHSLTQALRAELVGVRVCGVYPPAVDTPMSRHIPGPKLSPDELARAIVTAVQNGVDELYPGAAGSLRHALDADRKQVERQMAARLPLE